MFELRPYQRECVSNILSDIQNKFKRLAVVMPVAAGKTVMFSSLCNEWRKMFPDDVVLVLSHLSILTNQTHNRFTRDYPEVNVGIMQASKYPEKACDVIISTMQSSRMEHKIRKTFNFQESQGKKRVGMIIVDEMHFIAVNSYQKILSYFPDAVVVGVTATPWRDGYIMTNYFDKISYTKTTQELIDLGFLIQPELHSIVIDGELTVEERMAHVISTYQKCEDGKQAIVFMRTKEDAEQMAVMFRNHGYISECITCDITGQYRDDQLELFRQKKIQVLTTVNVLTAGFDAPCVEAIFMPYSTKSPTTYMQRIGRGLRIYPGKNKCNIYCFGDAPSVHRGVYEHIHNGTLGKNKEDIDIYDDLSEIEDSLGTDSTEYRWAEAVVNVANRVKELELKNIFEMIRKKDFPKRYLNNADMMLKAMPAVAKDPLIYDSPITDSQKVVLLQAGFTAHQINKMNKRDAMFIIETNQKMREQGECSFIIASGKHMGKHIKDLPYYYKEAILKMYPRSTVAKQIRNYYKQYNGGSNGN